MTTIYLMTYSKFVTLDILMTVLADIAPVNVRSKNFQRYASSDSKPVANLFQITYLKSIH